MYVVSYHFFFLHNKQGAHGRSPSSFFSIFHLHLLISISEPMYLTMDFPDGSADKESACNAGDTGNSGSTTPFSGRSPGGENGNPFPYSCLENSMDRGAWRVVVHEVAESDTINFSLGPVGGCMDTTEHAHISHWTYLPPSLWNLFLTSLKILPLNHHFQHSPLKTAPCVQVVAKMLWIHLYNIFHPLPHWEEDLSPLFTFNTSLWKVSNSYKINRMKVYVTITRFPQLPILCHLLFLDQLLFYNYFLSKANFTQSKSLLYRFVEWRHLFNTGFYYDPEYFYLPVSLSLLNLSPLPKSTLLWFNVLRLVWLF